MTKYLNKGLLILTMALLLSTAATAQFLNQPEIAKISGALSEKELKPGAQFKLTVTVDIKPGYHINGAGKDALYPTKLTVGNVPGVTFKAPVYPPPVKKKFSFSDEEFPFYEGKIKIVVAGSVAKNAKLGARTIPVSMKYQGCDDKTCLPPTDAKTTVTTKIVSAGKRSADAGGVMTAGVSGSADPSGFTGRLLDRLGSGGPVLAILISFLLGLTLCLTPCVYPMIPITVGFFAGQGQGHRSKVFSLGLAYIAGIAITYSALGLIASSFGLMIGAALQNPLVIGVIVAVFVALALSMFGLFEFRPPAALMNRTGARSGLAGALVMGLMVGVVASPCVGPAVAGVAVLVAQLQNPVLGFWIFFSMSLGMGLPFLALALFSGSISKLPMAGSWMVAFKKLSGLALLGVAAYFGRLLFPEATRDLVVPAYLLGAAVYLALFEPTLKSYRSSWAIRPVLGISIVLAGVWFLLPSHQPALTWEPYTPQAMEEAARAGKPVIIDFTAEWCVQCKELEHNTFTDERVIDDAARFVTLKADFTRDSQEMKALARQFGVTGLPTVIFIDSEGQEVESVRVTGFVPPVDFLRRMQEVQ